MQAAPSVILCHSDLKLEIPWIFARKGEKKRYLFWMDLKCLLEPICLSSSVCYAYFTTDIIRTCISLPLLKSVYNWLRCLFNCLYDNSSFFLPFEWSQARTSLSFTFSSLSNREKKKFGDAAYALSERRALALIGSVRADQTFHNFRSSKSVDWRFWATWN